MRTQVKRTVHEPIDDLATSQFIVGGLTNSVGHGGFDMFSLAYSNAGTLANQQAWGTPVDELCFSTGFNNTYGLPVAVGNALQTTEASWSVVSGIGSNINGVWIRRTGNKLDLAYDTAALDGSLSSISGVLDTGGGGEDALVLQFNP